MGLHPFWEIAIILALIAANGFFAAAEIAVIAAGKGTLRRKADEGDRAAAVALRLAENPSRFLPTVQIGITLVGTFAAAFGGAGLALHLAKAVDDLHIAPLRGYGEFVALSVVVLAISFLQVLLGELVPKRLALRNARGLALWVAWPMEWLATLARPFVWFMAWATDCLLGLFGPSAKAEPDVSVEDIAGMIRTAGDVLDRHEQKLALEALRLGERSVRDILIPKLGLDAIEVSTPPDEVLGAVAMASYSRLPVYEGDLDHILGSIHIRDVLKCHYLNVPLNLRRILHPVPMVPETLPLDRLLVVMQEERSRLAVVLDEFGATQGIVTLQRLIDELLGRMRDEHARDEDNRVVRRDDGSWLIDGTLPYEHFLERLEIRPLQPLLSRRFTTVAGLVLTRLGHIPKVGEWFDWEGRRIEVVDMDGPRIDRLLVGPVPSAEPPAPGSEATPAASPET